MMIRPCLAAVCLATSLIATPALLASAEETSKQTAQVSTQSIGMALNQQGGLPLHILYLHGIGATGGNDSYILRQHICAYLERNNASTGCSKDQTVVREYADQGRFNPDTPPTLTYLGQRLWKPTELAAWRASQPYVDHWTLKRKSGPPVLVDEINWWPLVLLPKCRTTIAGEAYLAGPNAQYLNLCAGIADPKLVKKGHLRDSSDRLKSDVPFYPYIPVDQANQLMKMSVPSAPLNHGLKMGIMDWGFSDAMLAVGPLHDLLVEGIRQLLVKTVISSGEAPPAHLANTDFFKNKPQYIVVSHSLGSYLIFSALNQDRASLPAIATPEQLQRINIFSYILYETSQVYFLANQVSLLELASLGSSAGASPTSGQAKLFDTWTLAHNGGGNTTQPQIVAWSDPSDLLTWCVPPIDGVKVVNVRIQNAIHWLWLFEGPLSAHDNYDKKTKVIQTLFEKEPVLRTPVTCPVIQAP